MVIVESLDFATPTGEIVYVVYLFKIKEGYDIGN